MFTTGAIWDLGQHKLLCGDSTDPRNLEIVLEGKKADITVCDPPYNVDYKHKMQGDNAGEEFELFLNKVCGNIVHHTRGAIYIWMASSSMFQLKNAFEKAGGHWSTFIIWAKNHFALSRGDYHRQFEPILYGWPKNGSRQWSGDRTQSDLWFYPKPARNNLHPTTKPVDLLTKAIVNSSAIHNTVLDPFGGSGSTLMACEKMNRRCCMIEKDPKYVKVIIDRWQSKTGQKARRVDA